MQSLEKKMYDMWVVDEYDIFFLLTEMLYNYSADKRLRSQTKKNNFIHN